MVKDAYEKLKATHNLPDFDQLDAEFNISSIDKEEGLMRSIRDKADHKIDYLLELLNIILQPDTNSFSDLYECRFFTEEEKTNAFDMYKRLMIADRTIVEAEVSGDEKTDAAAIQTAFDAVTTVKKQLLPLVVKMKTSWEKPIEKKEMLGYFG